ncbi:MAG: Eco57I restriction-modification methylase domain-containing protein [Armatimonadota bacterium]
MRYDASLTADERKRHGVFYTPESVVRYLLRATAPRGPVADLSCGDGAFLVEAARAGLPVMGIDRDAEALARAEEALANLNAERRLYCGDGLAPALPWTPDVVLGNPPYLEAKKTDPALKRLCRERFPAITRGAFDVFVPFLQAGLDALPPGGRLGYIIPNKFLIAEYARPLREILLRQATVEEIVDVSDLPTFRDAAVYPVLLVVRKAPPPPGHRVRTGRVTDLAQLETGDFPRGELAQAGWESNSHRVFWLPPTDATERVLVDRLLADEHAVPLSELLEVRWTVSFHRAGLRDRFIFPEASGRCPRRLLGGKKFDGNADVRRYRTAWSGWWIDYDEERAKTERNPLPSAALFAGPKLLVAQNARRIIATLDRDDFICKDTFLVGRPASGSAVPLQYLLGLLNSALLSYLYGILFKATHVNGAYLHYLSCYLGDLPVRVMDPEPVCALVNALLAPGLPETERRELDRRLDALIYDLYGLSTAERALVDDAVRYEWGEPAPVRGNRQSASHPAIP